MVIYFKIVLMSTTNQFLMLDFSLEAKLPNNLTWLLSTMTATRQYLKRWPPVNILEISRGFQLSCFPLIQWEQTYINWFGMKDM